LIWAVWASAHIANRGVESLSRRDGKRYLFHFTKSIYSATAMVGVAGAQNVPQQVQVQAMPPGATVCAPQVESGNAYIGGAPAVQPSPGGVGKQEGFRPGFTDKEGEGRIENNQSTQWPSQDCVGPG
jgi:hypothetical protein